MTDNESLTDEDLFAMTEEAWLTCESPPAMLEFPRQGHRTLSRLLPTHLALAHGCAKPTSGGNSRAIRGRIDERREIVRGLHRCLGSSRLQEHASLPLPSADAHDLFFFTVKKHC